MKKAMMMVALALGVAVAGCATQSDEPQTDDSAQTSSESSALSDPGNKPECTTKPGNYYGCTPSGPLTLSYDQCNLTCSHTCEIQRICLTDCECYVP